VEVHDAKSLIGLMRLASRLAEGPFRT
jgi:hypothetical protein